MDEILNSEDIVSSANIAAGTVRQELYRLKIPSGAKFEMTEFGNYVGDTGAWGNVYWDIFVDGSPVRNYSPMYDQYGSQTEMRKISYGYITAFNELVIYASNADSVTRAMGVTFKGVYKAG